jgi:PTS system ascorbate-specific IIB component
MVRVLVSCANGAGTSLLMKMTVEKVLKKAGVPIQRIHHCSISEGKSSALNYDVIFIPLNFMNMFEHAVQAGKTVIGLRNVMSEQEATTKVEESGILEKYKK